MGITSGAARLARTESLFRVEALRVQQREQQDVRLSEIHITDSRSDRGVALHSTDNQTPSAGARYTCSRTASLPAELQRESDPALSLITRFLHRANNATQRETGREPVYSGS